MTQQDYRHPITAPPELVQHWASEWMQLQNVNRDNFMTSRAAQWGADQELEACCEVLHQDDRAYLLPSQLRTARRPKPPSLKEQALGLLNEGPVSELLDHEVDTIRRALEQLPDNE